MRKGLSTLRCIARQNPHSATAQPGVLCTRRGGHFKAQRAVLPVLAIGGRAPDAGPPPPPSAAAVAPAAHAAGGQRHLRAAPAGRLLRAQPIPAGAVDVHQLRGRCARPPGSRFGAARGIVCNHAAVRGGAGGRRCSGQHSAASLT